MPPIPYFNEGEQVRVKGSNITFIILKAEYIVDRTIAFPICSIVYSGWVYSPNGESWYIQEQLQKIYEKADYKFTDELKHILNKQ